MRIMLLYIASEQSDVKFSKKVVPAEITALAAYLDVDHQVILVNGVDISIKNILKYIIESKIDLIYSHIYSHNRILSLKMLREIKKQVDVSIAAGGPFVTFLSSEIAERYSEIDYIIRGEPELTLKTILRALSKRQKSERVHHINPLLKMNDIPSLADATFEIFNLDVNEQYKYILTSRGSSHNTILTSYPSYAGSEIRTRTIRRLVGDIVNLQKKYGIVYFYFRDDNFLVDKERVISICNELIRRKVFILWTCYTDVFSLDEKILILMKRAGLHRLRLDIVSGSARLLQNYAPLITLEQVKKAAAIIRKVGIYLTVRLFTGLPGEETSDVEKTQRFLNKILPGKCEVIHAHYIPGTTLYEEAIVNGEISSTLWFKNVSAYISIQEPNLVETWRQKIKSSVEMIFQKSWYQASNFKVHRRVNGKNSWVTDLIEGDYYLHVENLAMADRIFRKITTNYPENPWGYLRMGKVRFRGGQFDSAFDYYRTVTELTPAYYGGWLKAEQALVADGKYKEGKRWIEEAYKRNRYDLRIQNVRDVLRHH